ncbi:MAG: hemerythrin domain-containing protein [Candidatus Omnitrophica bacterium]|nr:hemerythrin domain-containing protein [Candidatus Omnitrophota bacterium]
MNALNRLKAEHRRLLSIMAALESALAMGTSAWFVLRQICFSVSKQLNEHVRGEEQLLTVCYRVLRQVDAEDDPQLTAAHKDASEQLQHITQSLWMGTETSIEDVRPRLTRVLATVRYQMHEQEARVFPWLERVMGLAWVLQLRPLGEAPSLTVASPSLERSTADSP